ncbi:MAG TPA: N-acetylmuramoyl-L-alanine amidase [Cyclobacteriaceae bacterium]
MKNIAILSGFVLVIFLASFHTVGIKKYSVKKVVIDAGHGGKDPGASGKISREKHVALSIALKLGDIIKEHLPGVEVMYSRDNDTFIQLHQRSDLANKNGADLFISIHCNANNNKSVYGTETYVMGLHKTQANFEVAKRENAVIELEENSEENYNGFDPSKPESYILFSLYQSAYRQNSLNLAQKVEHQFKNRAGRRSRGVRTAGFLVLWQTSMPSILVETGYLSNPKEEIELNDELNQTYIASGIFRAFRDYKQELESIN